MNLLALDASTEACAVGIKTAQGDVFDAFEIAPRRHTELLPKMLDQVLAASGLQKSQINGCIVGVGPGAFTGIRVGLATIQGIALGLNVPCYGISSLHAIAQQALLQQPFLKGHVLASIDARMQEIYFAEYKIDDHRQVHLIGEEQLIANEPFKLPVQCRSMVGTGVQCVTENLSQIEVMADCFPSAKSLFEIYEHHDIKGIAPEKLQASYIRNQVTYQNTPKIIA